MVQKRRTLRGAALTDKTRLDCESFALVQNFTTPFNGRPMRTLKNSIIVAGLAMTFLTGCYTTLDGKSKFTTIPWRSDNFKLKPNWPPDKAMQAVQEVLALEGTITSKETTKNTVSARVNERYVWVNVGPDPDAKSPDISLITFQARTKWGNPDLALVNRLSTMTVAQLGTYTRTTAAAASN
jgi:hypothetical protein